MFQPVPTYADPAEVNPRTGKYQFSPVWLSWFLSLTNGGISGTISHNLLSGLQGGASNQYYHLTQSQYTNLNVRSLTAPFNIALTGSPQTYHNTATGDIDVIAFGTVSLIEFSRDNVTFYSVQSSSGALHLSPGDYIRITYTGTPTFTGVPR